MNRRTGYGDGASSSHLKLLVRGLLIMMSDLKVFAGSTHPEFAQAIVDHMGISLSAMERVTFSNENILVQIDENVRESDVFVIQTAATDLSDSILELLIIIDALRHASAGRITAVLPNFPYARSDKKDRPRISITARLVADLLETAGANRVLTMNLHSPQVQGFFHIPVDQLTGTTHVANYLKETRDLSDTVLVAADVGEAKEVGAYANKLNLPVAIIDKRRDGDDENAVATSLIGDVAGKKALIVDDEITSGGTVVSAAEFLVKSGATSVEVAVIHGVLSGRATERLSGADIKSVIITDTVPVPDQKKFDKLEITSVAHLFADAIQAIHDGTSVSKLFE